jgi:CcmD family protein
MRIGIIKIFAVAIMVFNLSPRSTDISALKNDSHSGDGNLFLEKMSPCNIIRCIPEIVIGDILLASAEGRRHAVSAVKHKEEIQGEEVEKDSYGGVMIKVALVVILIWLILGIYLFILDRKISKLERMIDEL